MNYSININGEKYRISIVNPEPLNSILSRHAAYIVSIPHMYSGDAFLWVLIDETRPVNAFCHIVSAHVPHSVVSIDYAMTYPYFQRCVDIMQMNGMHICEENIGLLVFTLFSWLKSQSEGFHHDAEQVYRSAMNLMSHYPEYFQQPVVFTQTYYEIIKRADEEPGLSIDSALSIQ